MSQGLARDTTLTFKEKMARRSTDNEDLLHKMTYNVRVAHWEKHPDPMVDSFANVQKMTADLPPPKRWPYAGHRTLSLLITVPPEYPYEPPQVEVTSKGRACPGLNAILARMWKPEMTLVRMMKELLPKIIYPQRKGKHYHDPLLSSVQMPYLDNNEEEPKPFQFDEASGSSSKQE